MLMLLGLAATGYGQGEITYENDAFTVLVDGNMNNPQYRFRARQGNDTDWYQLTFTSFFEQDAATKAITGGSQMSLPPLNWQIAQTDPPDSRGGLQFDITATNAPNGCHGDGTRFSTMKFHNVLRESAGVKFDVILDGYGWCESTGTELVLVFQLQRAEANGLPGLDEVEVTPTSVSLKGTSVYFSVNETAVSTASGSDSPVNVAISYNLDGRGAGGEVKGVQLVYDRFSGDLLHDPEFGSGAPPQAAGPTARTPTPAPTPSSSGAVPAAVSGALLLLAVLISATS